MREDVESVIIVFKDGTEVEYSGSDIRVDEVATEISESREKYRWLNIMTKLSTPLDMQRS